MRIPSNRVLSSRSLLSSACSTSMSNRRKCCRSAGRFASLSRKNRAHKARACDRCWSNAGDSLNALRTAHRTAAFTSERATARSFSRISSTAASLFQPSQLASLFLMMEQHATAAACLVAASSSSKYMSTESHRNSSSEPASRSKVPRVSNARRIRMGVCVPDECAAVPLASAPGW
eukprot:scaffold1930_cov346-Prasinococcus_capsulatus_cf.AAC.3